MFVIKLSTRIGLLTCLMLLEINVICTINDTVFLQRFLRPTYATDRNYYCKFCWGADKLTKEHVSLLCHRSCAIVYMRQNKLII